MGAIYSDYGTIVGRVKLDDGNSGCFLDHEPAQLAYPYPTSDGSMAGWTELDHSGYLY